MPYDPTNEHEETEVLVTDPEALEAIERDKASWSRYAGVEKTTEEILEEWRSETYPYYMVVEVVEGKAYKDSTFMEAFDILGKARAEAYNLGLFNRRHDEEGTTVEIRKHTYSKKNAPCVQKTGDTCWHAICLSIELVETIVC